MSTHLVSGPEQDLLECYFCKWMVDPAAHRGGWPCSQSRRKGAGDADRAPAPLHLRKSSRSPFNSSCDAHHQSRSYFFLSSPSLSFFFLSRLMPSAMPVPRLMSLSLISMLSTTARPTPSVSLLAVSVPSSKIRVMRLIVLPVGMVGKDSVGSEVSKRTRVHWAGSCGAAVG